jgi:outer membrane protein assembly factor BamB
LFLGRIYVGFSDGTVTAFDAKTGNELWQPVDLAAEAEQLTGDIPTYLDVDTTPLATEIDAGPVVIVGSYVGGVYALDANTGTQVWSNTNVAGVTDVTLWSEPDRKAKRALYKSSAPVSRELVLASTGISGLWALDPNNGDVIWQRALPRGGVSAPAAIAGALLVTSTDLGAFLVSPLDGSLIDGIHLTAGASATPAVYGTRAFILSDSGSLFGVQVTPPLTRPTKRSVWF